MAYVLNDNSLREIGELNTGRLGMLNKNHGLGANYTSRILVIGLGGMGLKTVLRLKSELLDRVGQISSSYLQFRVIDTDRSDRQKALDSGILTAGEIPDLNNSSIAAALAAPPDQRPVTIGDIIPPDFTQALTGEGANQVRLAGRLTVMDLNLFNVIYNTINNAISALQNFNTATLDVHIVAGIGGGSGSGMIIDIPYIVRAVVEKIVGQGGVLRLFGHVYLPNSYSGISNMKAAYRNGYAALKELDYYMNIKSTGETFDAKYPQPVGDFSSQENIFTQCTLIGGKIAGPMVITNPQEKAIAVCVDDLVNLCTSVLGAVNGMANGGAITDFFTNQSFQVNADNALNTVMQDPELNLPRYGNYCYNLIGASAIKFPTAAIAEQLIGEVSAQADAMLRSNVETIDQKAVDAFEKGLLKPIEIIEREAGRLEAVIDEINENPDTVWNKKTILSNAHTSPLDVELTKAIERFDKDSSIVENAVAAANNKATEIFKDPQRGPYYLAELLTSRSASGGRVSGLYEKVGRYFAATEELKTKCLASLADFNMKKREMEDEMQGFGKFGRNLQNYKALLKNIYSVRCKIELCDRLKSNYYVDLNQQRGATYLLKLSLDNNFLAYVDIFSAIAGIVENNRKVAAQKLGANASNDPTSIFSLSDPVFTPLRTTAMSTVGTKLTQLGADGPSKYAAALTSTIMENRAEWALTLNCLYGHSKIAEQFRKFLQDYPPFRDVIGKKMIDYFDEAYQGQTDAQKDTVVQQLISQATNNSSPMCNVWDPPYFNFASVSELCYKYLVLPNGLSAGANGWDQRFSNLFLRGATDNIYWSPDQDAIYSYTLYARMPIWVHKDLPDYEKEYTFDKMAVGVHTNEGVTQKTSFRKYPALMIPSQWPRTRVGSIVYANPDETAIFDQVTKDVRYAMQHGILAPDANGRYVINILENKPDPKDPAGQTRIKGFIDRFCQDQSNTENGVLVYEKRLFPAMCDAYNAQTRMIYGLRGYQPTTEESTVVLLRKQIKGYEALCAEIDYYRKNFVPDIEKRIGSRMKTVQRNNFAKYMLFGLVFAERGVWKYRLGDTFHNIVAAFEVQDDPANSWKTAFMEMAACDKLSEMENDPDQKDVMATHKKLLDDRVRTLQRQITEGDGKAFDDLKANYESLLSRCDAVVGAVDTSEQNGNILSPIMIEQREFYASLRKAATDMVALFGL